MSLYFNRSARLKPDPIKIYYYIGWALVLYISMEQPNPKAHYYLGLRLDPLTTLKVVNYIHDHFTTLNR